ncbi:ATP-binding protein [Xenorhabdus ishibashii]|uniref:Putative vacuolar sorting ATPase n=1 Tax=Xenorhabdus ishibashii TaxID=1034471 RepID=A0A2D0KAZ0_9GAMM|nr:AAA family ATPase [Xenorhabdus ishibashii]PHM60377.1 putative vacuolar sorting ATPase [Xenorhabdus ishibashii]
MKIKLENNNISIDILSRLKNVYHHIERIDLQLQYYFYQNKCDLYDILPEEFLLSKDEIKQRLKKPLGIPHWLDLEKNDILISQEISPPHTFNVISQLTDRFGLTEFERDVLLLGLLPYFDDRYHIMFSILNGNSQRNWPCLSLAINLFSQHTNDKQLLQNNFLPQNSLIKNNLLLFKNSEEIILSKTQFLTHNTVWYFLLGQKIVLLPLINFSYWHTSTLQTWFPPTLYHSLKNILLIETDKNFPLVILRGKQNSARELAVSNIMMFHGISTLILDLARLPEEEYSNSITNLIADAIREVKLHDACLLIRNAYLITEKYKIWHNELSFLFNQHKLRVILLTELQNPLIWIKNIPIVKIDMPVFTFSDKKTMLQVNLPDNSLQEENIIQLCRRFSFTPETLPLILEEATQYQMLRQSTGQLEEIDLRQALNFRAQQNFGALAQRITPKRSFKDLIVSNVLEQQLKEIVAAMHYREHVLTEGFLEKINYGTGISALFYGESGTGKTMAAEVIAEQLGVDLIKVDLSTVVNKYVGETEKNISQIFELAESDSGVLFFDEADALFGKRSEIKDARDRYANTEVSYLLQRLENYPGLVILATNNRSHLDNAFYRRLTFITRFTYPDEKLREKMWQIIWPKAFKLSDDIDFSHLSKKSDLTGANIRNIALLSSILSKNEHCEKIENKHIERAIILELNKIGRLTF